MTMCLTDEIGFISKKHLERYETLLNVSDEINIRVRKLDSFIGAMSFAYLAVVGDDKNNDLLNESYKHFLKEAEKILIEIQEKIDKAIKD